MDLSAFRRTFPKKLPPGTPVTPLHKFRNDQERWNKERKIAKRGDEETVKASKRREEIGDRYFAGGEKEEERRRMIEERRADRKAKRAARKKEMPIDDAVKSNGRKRKVREESVEGSSSKVQKRRKVKKIEEEEEEAPAVLVPKNKKLPHLGDSEIDSDDVPGEDMYGNEEADSDVDEEDRTVPLAAGRNPHSTVEQDEDEESEEEAESEQVFEDEEEEEEEEEAATDLEKFRKEMSSLPLSKVAELKEKLGIKLFNDAFFGKAETEKRANGEEKNEKASKKIFKRENSKRPREVSSKKPSSRFRPIYKEKKEKRIDPRFDERCGAFNEVIYEANYGFLDDLRKDEVKKMKKEVLTAKKEGDAERVERLRDEIRREENRQKAKVEKEMRMSTYKELKRENMERMKKGLEPKFIKRSAVKMKIMEKKFEQLKEDNQLDKYLRRKAKQESRRGARKQGGPKLGVGA